MRLVRYSISSPVNVHGGLTWIPISSLSSNCLNEGEESCCVGDITTCDKRGRMVTPEWPPTTGTSTSRGSRPRTSAYYEKKGKKIEVIFRAAALYLHQ